MLLMVHSPFIQDIVYCSSELPYEMDDCVLVEDNVRESFYATVVGKADSLPSSYTEPVRSILRKATSEDESRHKECLERAQDALTFCKQAIKEQMLPMKLIAVEMLFNMTKLIFYFTAPERVDFRSLVKSLVDKYRERIELKQVGVRNEVQLLGGIGSCGRKCCCTTFMKSVAPVSIKMAKQQVNTLASTKASGVCGRLSCCLSYEADRE